MQWKQRVNSLRNDQSDMGILRVLASSLRLLIVYATLLIGLALTVALRFFGDGGLWVVALHLLIAAAMAALIYAQYMHLRSATPLIRLFALAAFGWLYFMFTLMFGDFLSR